MTQRTRKILAQAGSFVLAGGLLYLALRGVDFSEVGTALRTAEYVWLLPLALVTILSHLFRAWRWQVLLEALPGETPRRVSLREAFGSLMIGYMVNYAAPRAGELARSAHLARRTRQSFSGVLGTVAVERLLDVLVLGLALVSVFFLLLDHLTTLDTLFFAPLRTRLGPGSVLVLGLGVLVVGGLVLLVYRRLVAGGHGGWAGRARTALRSFKAGLLTVLRSRRPGVILFSTLAMWFCYALMAYLPFVLFGMNDAFGLTLVDAWNVMILGAIGVALPSPGGTGSYHYITIETLVHLYGVARSVAASYAIVAHAGQMVLYVMLGFAFLAFQGAGLRTLREVVREPEAPVTAPGPAESLRPPA
ncbi:flippase-like domain-containing protein [Rhodocaloribacter litoris]|uniref:lysylphosphatidylglycerol synthase transmembrane domain-containing protein n=1 Tax=Rhodocaloribacter litoris TaxID=2558931 RepID=UPI0014235985|nr:lysylphosphatidylglycerol synthase transmembrane domain-containing protein [Rhodocaloribacter litoris]QXD14956.1 flippase-like domain-containing protein [Rhodocaloribacter litoris]